MAQSKRKTVGSDWKVLQVAGGLLLIIFSIYLLWVLRKGDGIHPSNLTDTLGLIGAFFYRVVHSLMGKGSLFAPLLLILMGLHLSIPRFHISRRLILSIIGIVCLILAWRHLDIAPDQSISYGLSGIGGGLIGGLVSYLFIKGFGPTGTKFILSALILVLIFVGSDGKIISWIRNGLVGIVPAWERLRKRARGFVFVEEGAGRSTGRVRVKEPKKEKPAGPLQQVRGSLTRRTEPEPPKKQKEEGAVFISNLKEYQQELFEEEKLSKVREYVESGVAEEEAMKDFEPAGDRYDLPALTLLKDFEKGGLEYNQQEIDTNAQILQQTLADFGVEGHIDEVSIGPSVTEYEFCPAPGNKVSKILNLADDLALNMATTGIRIQAPIPGKPAVGIEVPNKKPRAVLIREVLQSAEFAESESKLTVALGKDISGHAVVTDLAKMPHLLIAGSTGSGKSVCLNALIISILYKAKPYEVKFLMIDPKMVELGNYNGIPHLISPVVTDSKKAAGTLRWAVKEMERRYDLFANNGVKDIDRFNDKVLQEKALGNTAPEFEQLPKIVLIIDELSDLMMVAPADVEDAICRLAQMARAAGIHLVIATQRPSVDVITGIIKANIPSRIAFAVSSQVDSRTILDMGGAEKLLGRGDMLFYPTGMAKPQRLQGVFVTDPEIDRVVLNVKNQGSPSYDESVMEMEEAVHTEDGSGPEATDELLPDAAKLFIENGQASISMLQRHFRIGYTRAARIIDEMEGLGYVGPYEGSKPRQIRLSLEDYENTFGESKHEE